MPESSQPRAGGANDPERSVLGSPATALAAAVRAGELSAPALTEVALEAAADVQQRLNAFISVVSERARNSAAKLGAGHGGDLAGVPVVVKDNICVAGTHTTAGSRLLESFVPPYTATVVERLESAGAVVVAKTNLDEFGMGSTNENSAYGAVLNPHDVTRVAGGSSGGSAAAVAAGVVPLALGSDTGGSVRLPAAFCGIVGFKPTYGTLSRYGLVSYASSLDQIGVMARNVEDVRLAFDVMRGSDPLDATSLRSAPAGGEAGADASAAGASASGRGKPRIGVVAELSGGGVSAAARAALQAVVERLGDAGVEVVDVHLPRVNVAVATYYLIATAEASSNLARYDGTIYGARVSAGSTAGQEEAMTSTRGELFGREVRRRVLMGSYALSAGHYDAYYGRALKVRRLLANDLSAAFEGVDALLSPTAVSGAYALGEKLDDPVAMYVGDVATCLANLAGLPAISLPAGRDQAGLPLGLQLMGPVGADDRLLALAAKLVGSGVTQAS